MEKSSAWGKNPDAHVLLHSFLFIFLFPNELFLEVFF